MRRRGAIAIALILSCAIVEELRAQLRLRTLATGFTSPLAIVQDPTDRNVQFVVQQNGRIRAVQLGAVLPADFLDVSASIVAGGEQGLLGLAFPPDAAASGRFYVNFTNRSGNTVVARFRRLSSSLAGDAASRFDLRWGGATGPAFIAQPFANHNGGNLAFGPDGFLYIGLGDGGQGRWEEVDYEPRGRGGRNYGWRNREGAHDNVTSLPPAFQPLIEPIHEYSHSVGQSITGGYVYRGLALPASLRGRYFFADFIQGRVFSLALTVDANGEGRASDVVEYTAELGGFSQLGNISSFGVDANGELFIVS